MPDRWRQLADRYVERRRAEFDELVKECTSSERREILGRSGTLEPSPGLLAHFMSGWVCGSGARREELASLRRPPNSTIEVLRELLLDTIRMQFVKVLLLEARAAPRELTWELARGAVYTIEPSFNKHFISTCARLAPRDLHDALMSFLKLGSPWEAAGACNAFYWFDVRRPAGLRGLSARASGRSEIYLERFVHEDDLDLRRSFVGHIDWRHRRGVSALLREARRIASSHEDAYVRERFLHDIGESRCIPALPLRPYDPPAGTVGLTRAADL